MNINKEKKFVVSVLASLSLVSSAFAGDREWAVAGKVLTGATAIHVINNIVNPRPQVMYVYVQQPVVIAQPVVVAQPAVVAYSAPTTVVVGTPPPQVVYAQRVMVYPTPCPVVVRYGYGYGYGYDWHHHHW